MACDDAQNNLWFSLQNKLYKIPVDKMACYNPGICLSGNRRYYGTAYGKRWRVVDRYTGCRCVCYRKDGVVRKFTGVSALNNESVLDITTYKNEYVDSRAEWCRTGAV